MRSEKAASSTVSGWGRDTPERRVLQNLGERIGDLLVIEGFLNLESKGTF
jgi:hypothetical protein